MKKLLLGLLVMASSVFAADTITPRLGLIDPEAGSTGWASKMTHNFNVLDSSVAILSSTQTFTGGVTITSGTISTLRANSVLIATPTYSGSDVLVVNGTSRFQNSIFACDTNLLNCGSLDESTLTLDNGPTSASINILHDGSVNGGMLLRAAGTFINTTSNSPAPLYAKTITVGPDWYTAGTALETPSNSENAFEYAVLVGTTTNTANAKMVILSSSAYAYDLVVGSAPVPQGKYHLAVSTSGNVYIPSLTSGECMQVGTGGLLTTTGSGCGSGGGGSSSLAVFEDTTKVSSPTAIVKFDGIDFNVSLLGTATSYVTLGDSITVTGLTLSSITVRSIYWSDGTVQVSSPGAGGGSGDITGVAVSGEGITGGGTSGDVTIVLGSTVAYTTKNQTWTVPQTYTSSVTLSELLGGTTVQVSSITTVGIRAKSNAYLPAVTYVNTNAFAGPYSSQITFTQLGAGSATVAKRFYNSAGPGSYFVGPLEIDAGGPASIYVDGDSGGGVGVGKAGLSGNTTFYVSGNVVIGSGLHAPAGTSSSASDDGLYVKGQTSLSTTTFRNSLVVTYSSATFISSMTLSGGYLVQNIPPSSGQVLKFDGTNWAPGTDNNSGGGSGGYAVEPATVTFQLSKGVTASTGTFTDLLIGTTISASEVFQIDEETALRFIPSSSGTYVGVTRTTGTPAFATFVGHKAGQFANIGSGVTAVGYQACHGAGAGPSDSTTCVGQDAGLVLNGGINNTLIGIKAGQKMTDGSNNVCVGDVACNEVTSGAENVHLGNFAYSYTGTNSQNVLVGYQSQVGAGSRNTCLGTYSCSINTNQADNVAVGYSASIGAGATKAVAIGANATASQSNTMKLGGELSDSVTVLMSSSSTSGWSVMRGSATFVSSMTLSGGYLVQNIPPSTNQVLKFDGTNWAPGTDSTGGGGGTTIWVQKDDVDVDVSVSTIDVRSPLNLTSSPSGEANLDIDKSSFTLLGPDPTLGGALGGTISNATVNNDGHSHTGSTLSGIDVSDDTNLAASQPLVLTGDTLFLSTNVYVSKMGVSWDGGGSALTTGTTYWFPIPSSGTLTGFTLTGLPSGSVSINVSSSAIFNTGPVSICASACPVLSGGTSQRDTTLTGWAKTLAKDGFLYFVINSAGTSTQANLALEWIRL